MAKDKSKVVATWFQYKDGQVFRKTKKETGKVISEPVLGTRLKTLLKHPDKYEIHGLMKEKK
jgi:hypothetical protein